MKEKIKNILLREYEIAKFNITVVINVTKIQIKDFFGKFKPYNPVEIKNRKRKVQYRIPNIKIVGEVSKEELDEIHDSFVELVVNQYFKDYNCHVFKFKGDTYIRLDEPKKTEYIDMNELYGLAQKQSDVTFVDTFKRENYNKNK